jgi:hypothetical protein
MVAKPMPTSGTGITYDTLAATLQAAVNVEIAVRVELDALAERMNVDPVTLASGLLKRAMADLGSRALGPDQATAR